MSIENPVGGHPEDPYERYRIVREQEERGRTPKPPDKKPHLAAKLLALIKQTVESLVKLAHPGKSAAAISSPQENLFLLKTDLETLKIEDRSQDVPFLNHLSEIWHRVLEDSVHLQRSDPLYYPLQEFLEGLQSYPPGEEHSFGYYLTEYTGQQWLPFPYMDLIQAIYNDYQNHPKSSALHRWTSQIDTLRAIILG